MSADKFAYTITMTEEAWSKIIPSHVLLAAKNSYTKTEQDELIARSSNSDISKMISKRFEEHLMGVYPYTPMPATRFGPEKPEVPPYEKFKMEQAARREAEYKLKEAQNKIKALTSENAKLRNEKDKTKKSNSINQSEHKSNKSEAKYRFTGKTSLTPEGRVVFEIQATRDFDCIKKDELGGYIEGSWNLDPYDNSWVFPEGHISQWAKLEGNAKLISGFMRDQAVVKDDAKIINSTIGGKAIISNSATINDSLVEDNAIVNCRAYVNDALIGINAKIGGEATVEGKVTIMNKTYGGRDCVINGTLSYSQEKAGIDYPVLEGDPKYGEIEER